MSWDSSVLSVYRFENDGLDETANNNDLTVTGSPYRTADKYEGTYSVNSNSSPFPKMAFPAGVLTALSNATEYTFEFRVNPVLNQLAGLVGNSGANDAANQFGVYTYQNNVHIRFNNLTVLNAGALTNGSWQRINVEYKDTGTAKTLKVYIDGSLTYSGTPNLNPFTQANITPAGVFYSPSGGSYALTGYFDYLIISDVAKAGAETLPISEPTITDISPLIGSVSGGTAVTITGTGFSTGATVTFGGESATNVVVTSATEITCKTPAHTAGAVDVVITNTDTGTVTKANGYTYTADGAKSIGTFGFPKSRFKRQRLGAI